MDQRSIPKEGAKDVTFPRFRVIPKDTQKKDELRQFPWALEAVWYRVPDANRVQLIFMSSLSDPQMGCNPLFSLAIFLRVALVVFLQLLSHVWFFVIPWTVVCHTPLSFTISWSLLKFMSVESVMLSNHFFLCYSLLLLPPIFSRIRVFSNKAALHINL